MSHVPLLAKQNVPKLQPPRRGPQVVCLCLLAGIVFLLVPSSAYPLFLTTNAINANLTHATHPLPSEPLPPAVLRVIEASTQQHRLMMSGNPEETIQDLVAAVGYLAQRELKPR